jgi:hypothetical protein
MANMMCIIPGRLSIIDWIADTILAQLAAPSPTPCLCVALVLGARG